jgi:hypothetical protein
VAVAPDQSFPTNIATDQSPDVATDIAIDQFSSQSTDIAVFSSS